MQSSSSSNERFYAKLVSLEVDKDMLEQLCLKLLSQTEMRQRAAVTEGKTPHCATDNTPLSSHTPPSMASNPIHTALVQSGAHDGFGTARNATVETHALYFASELNRLKTFSCVELFHLNPESKGHSPLLPSLTTLSLTASLPSARACSQLRPWCGRGWWTAWAQPTSEARPFRSE